MNFIINFEPSNLLHANRVIALGKEFNFSAVKKLKYTGVNLSSIRVKFKSNRLTKNQDLVDFWAKAYYMDNDKYRKISILTEKVLKNNGIVIYLVYFNRFTVYKKINCRLIFYKYTYGWTTGVKKLSIGVPCVDATTINYSLASCEWLEEGEKEYQKYLSVL